MKDETTKVSANRQKKEAILAELVEKVEKSKGMVFTNYQGLTHKQLETLKRAMRKIEAEYVASKNTLFLRALEGKLDKDADGHHFTQPTAALFMYGDIVEPVKALAKTIKELKLPVIKFGLVEGKSATDKDIEKLATLPPLPVLQAQLLGQMMSPISGLHRALNWNLQSLVMTLNAIAQKKQ